MAANDLGGIVGVLADGVLDLPALIRAKRAAGRPKDLEALAELEALMVEQARRT